VSLKTLLLAILFAALSAPGVTAQTNGSEWTAAIQRGNERVARQDYKTALEEYRRVPPSAGDHYALALYNIGVCNYELWRTDDAIESYRKAVAARGGDYAKAWYALGVAFEDQTRPAEAKEAYRQAIATSRGEYAMAQYKLGVLFASERDYETAATLFREAIARSGDHFPASHNNLGVMLAQLGRLTEADREFQIAVKQTHGTFDDAVYNHKLCRTLLTVAATTDLAALKLSRIRD
jgi:tetratricopeptide (TPR) repeat protein